MKEPESLQQVGRTFVIHNKRRFSFFGGCDYFRMSSHPEVLRAVKTGLAKYGLNVAASRITTGNHALYRKLETALARFFGAPAALLVSNGFSTNPVVAQALGEDCSHVLLDAKAHVSLGEASRLFGCPVLKFKNRDPEDLRRVLARLGGKSRPILLTDGVYTQSGGIAPLKEYLKVVGSRGTMLVDDSHGAGVIGTTGRGTPEHAVVPRGQIIQTVTLSKAFGVYGGAILCSRELRRRIFAGSAMFAGSTPLPLPLVNAALRAIEILRKDRGLLKRLKRNAEFVKTAFRAAGFSVPLSPVPVIAINPESALQAAALRRNLIRHGIYPSFVKYPGGPAGGYFRFVISSEHSKRQLDDLVAAASSFAESRVFSTRVASFRQRRLKSSRQ